VHFCGSNQRRKNSQWAIRHFYNSFNKASLATSQCSKTINHKDDHDDDNETFSSPGKLALKIVSVWWDNHLIEGWSPCCTVFYSQNVFASFWKRISFLDICLSCKFVYSLQLFSSWENSLHTEVLKHYYVSLR